MIIKIHGGYWQGLFFLHGKIWPIERGLSNRTRMRKRGQRWVIRWSCDEDIASRFSIIIYNNNNIYVLFLKWVITNLLKKLSLSLSLSPVVSKIRRDLSKEINPYSNEDLNVNHANILNIIHHQHVMVGPCDSCKHLNIYIQTIHVWFFHPASQSCIVSCLLIIYIVWPFK